MDAEFYTNKIAILGAVITSAHAARTRLEVLNSRSYSPLISAAIGNIDAYMAEKTAEMEQAEKLLDDTDGERQ